MHFDLEKFIAYLETTNDADWSIGRVRTEGNKKNCMFGHLVNFYYGKDYEGDILPIWDFFEECYATTYMIYPVNDGENSKYQQSTAKARIIAYLSDIKDGKQKTSQQLMQNPTY